MQGKWQRPTSVPVAPIGKAVKLDNVSKAHKRVVDRETGSTGFSHRPLSTNFLGSTAKANELPNTGRMDYNQCKALVENIRHIEKQYKRAIRRMYDEERELDLDVLASFQRKLMLKSTELSVLGAKFYARHSSTL